MHAVAARVAAAGTDGQRTPAGVVSAAQDGWLLWHGGWLPAGVACTANGNATLPPLCCLQLSVRQAPPALHAASRAVVRTMPCRYHQHLLLLQQQAGRSLAADSAHGARANARQAHLRLLCL